jgi:aryl-alcohol dehydrogenase-like predicted oxidoreductase
MTHRFSPRRVLGRTGFVATTLGAGDLADRSVPKKRCVATLRRAFDAGLNVVDTAPMYEDGFSEEIVGEALRGRREGIFLVDKIDHLDRPVSPQLDESLRRLELASVDLLVLHSCSDPESWRRARGPGGTMAELNHRARFGDSEASGLRPQASGLRLQEKRRSTWS